MRQKGSAIYSHYVGLVLCVWCAMFGDRAALAAANLSASGYTYQRFDGNRVVVGRGTLPNSRILDIPLAGRPIWLVAAAIEDGSVWAVTLADGRIQMFRVANKRVIEELSTRDVVPPGTPPVLGIEAAMPRVLVAPTPQASPLTHPIPVSSQKFRMAFIDKRGNLVFWQNREVAHLRAHALPDARLIKDEKERVLLLTGPTTRYRHGVLGDAIEATGLMLIETMPVPRVVRTMRVSKDLVIEGIAPIWSDVTGDGAPDVVVTVSDHRRGARIVVFDTDGGIIAEGPAIGQGFRWRHQLAVAPFGPRGELEVAAVRTPHIGGVVEFYRIDGTILRIVAEVEGHEHVEMTAAADFVVTPSAGYGSHALGSRNLDMAIAGDLDGDGRIELLVPTHTRTALAAVRRVPGDARVVWSVRIGGQLSTNLAAVAGPDGGLILGAGHEKRTLRLWLP